ncbi:GtrA family protein [Dyella humicola]|uniref:GtrA family protein n=1 Tax=Dyella humicola TaxID=2992126 RepID=UPI0022525536|nr:GtrA family protein [Dyella humicola]
MKLEKRFITFLLVGLLNTLFGLAAYAILIHVNLPIWLALIGGNVAGIAFNFFTTGHLVFSDIALNRLPRFVTAYLACYVLNYVAIRILVSLHLGAIKSQVLLAPAIAVTSYYLMSQYVFGRSTAERPG